MNLTHIPGMLFSPGAGWAELMARRPPVARLLFNVFLPFSLLPPLMIVVAADGIAASVFPAVGFGLWGLVAMGFFIAEWISLPLLAWFIRETARTHHGVPDTHDARVIAILAPIPMWLSSLALMVPNVPFIVTAALTGLVASAFLVRHGVRAMLGVREITEAGEIALLVICAGVLAWAAMIALVLIPAMLAG